VSRDSQQPAEAPVSGDRENRVVPVDSDTRNFLREHSVTLDAIAEAVIW